MQAQQQISANGNKMIRILYSFVDRRELIKFKDFYFDSPYDAFKTAEYLRARGVQVNDYSSHAFTVDHLTNKHRTATELMISGCPRNCTLRIEELT